MKKYSIFQLQTRRFPTRQVVYSHIPQRPWLGAFQVSCLFTYSWWKSVSRRREHRACVHNCLGILILVYGNHTRLITCGWGFPQSWFLRLNSTVLQLSREDVSVPDTAGSFLSRSKEKCHSQPSLLPSPSQHSRHIWHVSDAVGFMCDFVLLKLFACLFACSKQSVNKISCWNFTLQPIHITLLKWSSI